MARTSFWYGLGINRNMSNLLSFQMAATSRACLTMGFKWRDIELQSPSKQDRKEDVALFPTT